MKLEKICHSHAFCIEFAQTGVGEGTVRRWYDNDAVEFIFNTIDTSAERVNVCYVNWERHSIQIEPEKKSWERLYAELSQSQMASGELTAWIMDEINKYRSW